MTSATCTALAALLACAAWMTALGLLCRAGARALSADSGRMVRDTGALCLALAAFCCLPCGVLPSLASSVLQAGEGVLPSDHVALVAMLLGALSLGLDRSLTPGQRQREAGHLVVFALIFAVCARYAWLRGAPGAWGALESRTVTPLWELAANAEPGAPWGLLLLAVAALPWGTSATIAGGRNARQDIGAAHLARRWLYAALWCALFAPPRLPCALSLPGLALHMGYFLLCLSGVSLAVTGCARFVNGWDDAQRHGPGVLARLIPALAGSAILLQNVQGVFTR